MYCLHVLRHCTTPHNCTSSQPLPQPATCNPIDCKRDRRRSSTHQPGSEEQSKGKAHLKKKIENRQRERKRQRKHKKPPQQQQPQEQMPWQLSTTWARPALWPLLAQSQTKTPRNPPHPDAV
jgi:hypothetical protein